MANKSFELSKTKVKTIAPAGNYRLGLFLCTKIIDDFGFGHSLYAFLPQIAISLFIEIIFC
jgi:hypothetical protein